MEKKRKKPFIMIMIVGFGELGFAFLAETFFIGGNYDSIPFYVLLAGTFATFVVAGITGFGKYSDKNSDIDRNRAS